MKPLVTLVQLALVAAILYPVYYVWDTGRIENFCHDVKPGMTLEQLNALAENNHIHLNAPKNRGESSAQWMTSVDSRAAVGRYACVIIGAVDRVASAHLVEE